THRTDPNVRRLVYNMYRGMLGTYNDKANDIISTLPKEMVREDQGIARQLESMMGKTLASDAEPSDSITGCCRKNVCTKYLIQTKGGEKKPEL
ncbi:hypothetical protein L9F63_011763, partial [Diploptera punctata]